MRPAEEVGGIVLREYQPADFYELCEIDQICFPPGIAYPPQDLSYWIRQPRAFVFVAEDPEQRKIAGFTIGRLSRPGEGHVVTIDIRPEYRRKAVASALMERAHARLQAAGATYVRLETSVENQPAINFYRKLGYRMKRRLPRYYLDRIDAWEMVKQF